jgi:glycosyltransferase involved in cell wall biosynthesis
MLEQKSVLAALQTSTAWSTEGSDSISYKLLSAYNSGAAKRRTVNDLPQYKVRSTMLPEAAGFLISKVGVSGQARYRLEDWFLGFAARRGGLSGATVVLNSAGNGGIGFLDWAKRRGIKIATDVIITPRVFHILEEEMERWPGWESIGALRREKDRYVRHMEKVVSVSDLLISPSDTVDDGLATIFGFSPDKLVRVPYGLGAEKIHFGNPVPKRVLFSGQAGLRKGIPYLASAAKVLRPLGYEVRVAGSVSQLIKDQAICSDLNFLGHLGPDQMADEFNKADVFCLPSLAEGMASVTLEALARGLPCVVTRASGSPVAHGVEGLIVAERDADSLVHAIRAICEDRILRSKMSHAALAKASEHDLSCVGEKMYSALSNLS